MSSNETGQKTGFVNGFFFHLDQVTFLSDLIPLYIYLQRQACKNKKYFQRQACKNVFSKFLFQIKIQYTEFFWPELLVTTH